MSSNGKFWAAERLSALKMVTIKPPSTGEARKVSVEKVVPVSFSSLLDSQNVRSRIADQNDHKFDHYLPEFGHLDWKPRAKNTIVH